MLIAFQCLLFFLLGLEYFAAVVRRFHPPNSRRPFGIICLLACFTFLPFCAIDRRFLQQGRFCNRRLSTVDCQGDGSRYPSHRHWLYHDQHVIAVRSALIKRLCMRYIAPNAIFGHRGSLPIWIGTCIGDRKEFVPNQNGKKRA